MLIQWVSDEVKIVHADTSACVVAADATYGTHDNVECLTSVDLSNFEYISYTKDGFVSSTLKPVGKSTMSQEEE